MLYVKMLPYDKQAGRTTRDFTITNPDTGEPVMFKAGDPEWSAVSDMFGEMLSEVRVHQYLVNSPRLFLVATETEADRIDREDSVRRKFRGRKQRPRRANAKDLTSSIEDADPLTKMSKPVPEEEAELSDVEALQAENDELQARLAALEEKFAALSGPSPVMAPLPDAGAPSLRAEALGITDEPADDEPSLTSLRGIGESVAGDLALLGISSLSDLVDADPDLVADTTDSKRVTADRVRSWQDEARKLLAE